MMMRRHRGFVIGYLNKPEGPEWAVRVKDPQSQFDKQRFIVGSVQGDLELAAGLSVEFAVGNCKEPLGKKVSKAIEVGPQT